MISTEMPLVQLIRDLDAPRHTGRIGDQCDVTALANHVRLT
jgi:hypothetical protein